MTKHAVFRSTSDIDSAALRDLISDAEGAEAQAETGPFYPDRGITPDTLRAYAAKCRADIERLRDGGAHAAVLRRA